MYFVDKTTMISKTKTKFLLLKTNDIYILHINGAPVRDWLHIIPVPDGSW